MPKLEPVNRRDFLRTISLTSLVAIPGVQGFAQLISTGDCGINPALFIDRAFRLVNFKSMLSLEFYFVNVEQRGNYLKKCKLARGDQDSFMIIRLPQQHIAEQFFDEQKKDEKKKTLTVTPAPQKTCADDESIIGNIETICGREKPVYAETIIAGYSYLAFELVWANMENEQLSLAPDVLLNWNAPWFYLLVRKDLGKQIFEIVKRTLSKPNKDPKGEDFENIYPLGYRKSGNDYLFDRESFPKTFSSDVRLYKGEKKGRPADAAPITAIEAPYGLIISPQLPDPEYDYEFRWTYSQPTGILNSTICKKPDRPVHYDELWIATLQVKKKIKKEAEKKEEAKQLDTPKSDLKEQKNDAGDDLMRLMMIGVKPKELKETFELLPDQSNKEELVKDYIRYRLAARTTGLSFTPLGISTKINFLNSKYFQIAEATAGKNSADIPHLYEWKQEISFGRDQEVMTSTLVMEACHGLKMLHIKSTKRQTFKGVSMLVYREYLQPLDPKKDMTLYDHKNVNEYKDPCYCYNTPFKAVEFAEWDAKQILPLHDMSTAVIDNELPDIIGSGECVLAFWPHRPGHFPELPNKEKRLKWKFRFTSHDGVEHVEEKEIYILTINIVYGKESYVNPFPDAIKLNLDVKLYDADKKFKDLGTFKNELRLTGGPSDTVWENVSRLGGDFDLQHLDHYRIYLDELLKRIEDRLRAASGFIEDEVIEKFQVYKQKIMAMKSDMIETIGNIKEQLRFFNERKSDPVLSAAKTAIDELNKQVDELQVSFENNLKQLLKPTDTTVSRIKGEISRLVTVVNAAINESGLPEEFKKRKDQLLKTGELLNSIPSLINRELEKEFEYFVNELPRQLTDQLLSATIKPLFDDLHQCLRDIREKENSLSGKIRFKKAQINYAVHGVEEDLEALKEKIKLKFPDDWELEYEKLRAAYFKELSKISELQTEFIVFRNNFRQKLIVGKEKVLDFFHEYACVPQMHTAKVCIKAVNDMVQKEVFVRIKYAEDYFKNQTSDLVLDVKNNTSRVFAEIKSESKEFVKGAIRNIAHEMGGIVNPDMAADFLTFAKDLRENGNVVLQNAKEDLAAAESYVRDQVDEMKNELKNTADQLNDDLRRFRDEYKDAVLSAKNDLILMGKEAKENFTKYKDFAEMNAKDFFKGLEAKILGGIHLKDILGVGFDLPKLDRKGNKIVYNFITDKIVEKVDLKVVSFQNPGKKAKLIIYFEKPLSGGGFVSWTTLNNFIVGVFEDRLTIEFEKIQFYSDKNTKNKVSVDIKDVHFKKELAFLEALSKNIQIPGTGLSLSISPKQIAVDFAYTVPGISGGAFTLTNLKFMAGVIIPLPIGPGKSVSPIIVKFGINGPDDKFVVAAGIWGGRGFFVIEATPKYIRRIDMGMDYGGYFGLSLGIASGEGFLMAGIRYVFKRDEMGVSGMEFYAILTAGGYVTVFGFITLSVVFLLCLKYQSYGGYSSLYGTASVTYSVKIGFFKKSFSLTFTKRMAGSDNPNSNSTGYMKRDEQDGIYYADTDESQDSYYRFAKYEEGTGESDKEDPNSLTSKYNSAAWKRFCRSYLIESTFTTDKSLYG